MKAANFNVYFFFVMLIGVGMVMFFVLQPFLTAILAAAILAALFYGWYESLLHKTGNRPILSSTLAILLIALIIIGPIFAVGSVAFGEMNAAYDRLIAQDPTGQSSLASLGSKLRAAPFVGIFFQGQSSDGMHLLQDLKGFGENIFGLIQTLYQGVAHFIFWLFVMFFSLFYFFIDGKRMLHYAMSVMPLRDEHERLLMSKFVSMSRATLRGTLMVGAVQGFLGGVMFAIAGVPSPVVWGFVMMLLSVIPMIGAGMVWFPVGIVMLLLGHIWQGIFILAFGMGVISTIDNILRPKLVGHDTQMHPLLVFFATLGGISMFGFSGFVIGPIVASLFLALLDIYALEFRVQLREYNK